MFTLTDTPIKFVALLVLFTFTTVWCTYELARSRGAKHVVSNALHLVMSVVMFIMVPKTLWQPFHMVIPLPALIAFFVASSLWFVGLAIDAARRERGLVPHFIGHGLMMGAMAWHMAGMAVHMSMHAHGGQHGHATEEMMMQAKTPGGSLWWVAVVGVVFMGWLAYAAVKDLITALRPTAREHTPVAASPVLEMAGCHEPRPVGSLTHRLSALDGCAMNFGMFWMSTGLMTVLLPFFKYFAF